MLLFSYLFILHLYKGSTFHVCHICSFKSIEIYSTISPSFIATLVLLAFIFLLFSDIFTIGLILTSVTFHSIKHLTSRKSSVPQTIIKFQSVNLAHRDDYFVFWILSQIRGKYICLLGTGLFR